MYVLRVLYENAPCVSAVLEVNKYTEEYVIADTMSIVAILIRV